MEQAFTEQDKQENFLQKLMGITVGPVPILIYIPIAIIILAAASAKKLPIDMIGGFACIMVLGFLFGDVGGKIPVLRNIGGPAILSLFIPSAMIGMEVMNPEMNKAITAIMKTSNFLYFYIACLVAGSLLGMNRRVLIQGFLRMFVPLAVGTVAAVASGMAAGLLFGYDLKHTFFFIIIPIMGGGIGEGVLPTSIAYAEILGKSQAEMIAQLVPAALIGNVVAIVSAGVLKRIGEKFPRFSGNGLLVRSGDDAELLKSQNEIASKPLDLPLMGAGMLIACTFFIAGGLLAPYTGIPGPILMILIGAMFKITNLMPARMEQGAYQMYRFIATNLTFPLMVGLGALYMPWNKLVEAFTFSYFIICSVTVLAMIASGWVVGALMNMYQVETALVNACHSGLGGTGDVAILSAAERMEMMPFAQISTRIGGACMVVSAVFLLRALT
ncbi:MAG: malate permease [Burkholderiaceae bacterium]|nr:malate permease [Burkholderiaceae bacterium]